MSEDTGRPDSDFSAPPENWSRQSPYRTCPECEERVNIGKTPVDCIDHVPIGALPEMCELHLPVGFDSYKMIETGQYTRCQRALSRAVKELKAAIEAIEHLKNSIPRYTPTKEEEAEK